jgi:isoleucyl-tRNA synthetase
MDVYDVATACALVREHLDVLTNWYVRTQRDRFWAEDDDAFDALYTALVVLTQVTAPLAPMVAEEIWRGLTGGRSVHLTDWPAVVAPVEPALTDVIDGVRQAVSTTLGLRKAHQIRVRQPLRTLTVAVADPEGSRAYTELLAGELNVKQVVLVHDDEETAARYGISRRLTVNARAAGPRLGRAVQGVIQAAKAGAWRETPDGVVVTVDGSAVALEPSEYELATVVAASGDGQDRTVAAAVLPDGAGFVVLDLTLDDELRAEGVARDAIRAVQDARKAAGLNVSDRIRLTLGVPGGQVAAIEAHRDVVARETLAIAFVVREADDVVVELEVAGA